MKDDLEDAKKSPVEDNAFLMEKHCKLHEAEWAVHRKIRAEQVLDTIRIFMDDELFKKAIPSPSLLQVKARAQVKHLDLKALAGSKHDLRVGPIAMLLRGCKMSFDHQTYR